MSKTTKRKHVLREIFTDEYELPQEKQSIVRLLASKGNNLHQVESTTKEKFLVSMPTKFRKNIWVKRGDFVLVEPILEGDKVKAEIVKILNPDIIKFYRQNDVWPKEFTEEEHKVDSEDLFVNTNRQVASEDSCSESDDTSDSEESSDDNT